MVAALAACLLALSLPATAGAQTAAGSGSYGGTQFYVQPVISALQCRDGCSRAARVSQPGWVSVKEKGVLRIRGRNFGDVGEVLFLGGAGRGDNVGVKPQARTTRTLDVKVPVQAGSGKIVLLDPAGRGSKPSQARLRILRSASSLSAQGFTWPLPARGMLTGHYGENRGDHVHSGVDLAIPTGTPIKAVAEGRVILVGPQGAYGNFTCLRHASLVSCYAHQSVIQVTFGQLVKQGQVIGKVGCTGRCSGSHLHFEVRQGPDAWSTPLDPFRFLPRRF
jgi:murein DD-endopeptidase MepM/ murein hydrolase activator NlpD